MLDTGQMLTLLIGGGIGVTLGALGSGGTILTIPVLVYVAGVEPRTAIAMSLAVIGAASLAGAFLHYRQEHFNLRASLLFGITGMGAAYAASALTRDVSSDVLMLLLAGLMMAVGALMLRGRSESAEPGVCRIARCAGIGAGVGALTGFLGVGGGFLIVPALVLFAGIDTKTAVGTSLAIIALNSAAGLIGQIRFVTLDWGFTAFLLAATLAGLMVGLKLVERVRTTTLTRAFAVVLILTGAAIGTLRLAGVEAR